MDYKKISLMKVLANEKIAKDTFKLKLDSGDGEFAYPAGTFLNIRLNSGLFILRRPISIFEYDEAARIVTVIYKIMGEGTLELSRVKAGDRLDVMGPLGNGFPIFAEPGKVLLIGGGVGVPPLYELGKRLKAEGREVVSVLGFRDSESIFAREEFAALGDTYICTDDGSCGFHGNVAMGAEHHGITFDVLYGCGPLPMLKAIDLKYRDSKPGYLSFEERMACGIGACYACMTRTKDGLKRVCKDGPVFKMGEAVYE